MRATQFTQEAQAAAAPRRPRMPFGRLALGAATLAVAAGCSMQETGAPALTGPSSFGTSVVVSASPDVLPQDGVSTSQIVVEVRGADGQPVRNQPVRLDVFVGTTTLVMRDVGQLTSKNPVTGQDGRAIVTYRAPEGAQAGNSPSDEILVTITATPVGTDHGSALARSVRLRLVPLGTIL